VEATALETLREPPSKVEPFCPKFSDCGGCAWQDFGYSGQLLWKRGRVEAALSRIAKVEIEVPPVIPSPSLRGYRNKMVYVFGSAKKGILLGLRKRGSHDVCPLTDNGAVGCPLQSPRAGKILETVHGWAVQNILSPWNGQNGTLRYLVLREPSYHQQGRPERMVELICGDKTPSVAGQQDLWAMLTPLGVTSFVVSQRRNKLALAKSEKIVRCFGTKTLREEIGHLVLEFPAQGFVQTNTAAASELYVQIRELAKLTGEEIIWDIYAGVGALGLYLADQASAVLGIELEREAVNIAQKNAFTVGYSHCRFVAGDAAKMLPAQSGRPHLLVTDPPRGGMSPKLIPAIKAKNPAKIIYVSCDPATLARDVAALAPKYKLTAIRVVDMFPHTPHVECVALLNQAYS
jgi:23S rRNA (uracil1939-C5)-methyltransferase